jgi:hypothetical protein
MVASSRKVTRPEGSFENAIPVLDLVRASRSLSEWSGENLDEGFRGHDDQAKFDLKPILSNSIGW